MTTPQGWMAVIGSFDGVHRGHRWLIDELTREASLRGVLPMVVTFDHHPLHHLDPNRAPALITADRDRIAMLRSLPVRDVAVLPFPEIQPLTAAQFLMKLRRDLDIRALALGFNNRFGSDRPSDYTQAAADAGVEIVRMTPFRQFDVSSTLIRQAIADGRIEDANRMLGRQFSLSGSVVTGQRLGHRLGFPTANITPPPGLAIPKPGVYAASALLHDGSRHNAVVNIGSKPTVSGSPDAPLTIEAHIIGFNGNLYGHDLTLGFTRRIRPEQRFPSLDALRSAIQADIDSLQSLSSE